MFKLGIILVESRPFQNIPLIGYGYTSTSKQTQTHTNPIEYGVLENVELVFEMETWIDDASLCLTSFICI